MRLKQGLLLLDSLNRITRHLTDYNWQWLKRPLVVTPGQDLRIVRMSCTHRCITTGYDGDLSLAVILPYTTEGSLCTGPACAEAGDYFPTRAVTLHQKFLPISVCSYHTSFYITDGATN